MRYKNVRSWCVSSLDIFFAAAGALIGTCARPLQNANSCETKRILNCSELLNAMRKNVYSHRDRKVHAKVSHKSGDLFIHKGRTKNGILLFLANTCIRHNSILHRARASRIQNFRSALVVVVGFVECMQLHITHFFSFIFCVDSVRRLPWLLYVLACNYGAPFKLKSIWILSHYSFLAFNFREMHLSKTILRCAYELHCIIMSVGGKKESVRRKVVYLSTVWKNIFLSVSLSL